MSDICKLLHIKTCIPLRGWVKGKSRDITNTYIPEKWDDFTMAMDLLHTVVTCALVIFVIRSIHIRQITSAHVTTFTKL